jgi:hypothetical protein
VESIPCSDTGVRLNAQKQASDPEPVDSRIIRVTECGDQRLCMP